MKKILILSVFIIALITTISCAEKEGKVADFTLPDFDGNMHTLSDFEGLIILDFWATWCPPCRVEVPYLQAFYDEYKDKGLTIIGISNEPVATQKKFQKEMQDSGVKMDYILLVDSTRKAFGDYGIEGIPTTIFTNSKREMIFKEVGFAPQYAEKFREVIEANLPK